MRPGRERKRLKKLAAKIQIDEIQAWLSDQPDPTFLVGNSRAGYCICSWNEHNGLMMLTMEDDVASEAIKQRLLNDGLVFENYSAVETHAHENNWASPIRS